MNRIKFLTKVDVWYDSTDTSPKIAEIDPNTITEYEYSINGWYKIKEFHWVYLYKNNKKTLIEVEDECNIDNTKIKYINKEIEKLSFDLNLFGVINDTTIIKDLKKLNEEVIRILNPDAKPDIETEISRTTIDDLTGIFGIPYQFMPSVDRRLDYTNNNSKALQKFGRKYSEKIVSRLPLLVLQPGQPLFMAGYNEEDKRSVLDSVATGSVFNLNLLKSNSDPYTKYYSFMPAWTEFAATVNPMLQLAAIYMGLTEYRGQTDLYSKLIKSKKLGKALNYYNSIAFYLNSDAQISEDFGNGTQSSMLKDKLNQISDYAREIQFLMGSNKNLVAVDKLSTLQNQVTNMGGSAVGALSGALSNGQSLMSAISNSISTLVAGGKMMLPEIWSDSSFSRQFTLNIKLISPDNDDESVFLNIIVPLLILVGMVAPRASGPNAYVSPYILRAHYRSFFNIDMGIITSLTVNKGGEGNWNHLGIPTCVEISFQIKELLPLLSLSSSDNKVGTNCNIQDNPILMDYIGNLCGVNINEPDIYRWALQKAIMTSNRVGEVIDRHTYTKIMDGIYTKAYSIFMP